MTDKCNHITEIWSIYDGGILLVKEGGSTEDMDYDGYICKFCPECGAKLKKEDEGDK